MSHPRWKPLLDRIPPDRPVIGAEVGVFEGRLSEQLLRARPLLSLHCIDRWRAPDKTDSYYASGSKVAGFPQERFDLALASTRYRLMAYITAGRCRILRAESDVAGRHCLREHFDFVFIDADHSYQGCMRDLTAWAPCVKPGGYLCGHDYGRPDQGEVKRAVDEFFAGGHVETDDAWTWFYHVPYQLPEKL